MLNRATITSQFVASISHFWIPRTLVSVELIPGILKQVFPYSANGLQCAAASNRRTLIKRLQEQSVFQVHGTNVVYYLNTTFITCLKLATLVQRTSW
jgi:hypothetical protein